MNYDLHLIEYDDTKMMHDCMFDENETRLIHKLIAKHLHVGFNVIEDYEFRRDVTRPALSSRCQYRNLDYRPFYITVSCHIKTPITNK